DLLQPSTSFVRVHGYLHSVSDDSEMNCSLFVPFRSRASTMRNRQHGEHCVKAGSDTLSSIDVRCSPESDIAAEPPSRTSKRHNQRLGRAGQQYHRSCTATGVGLLSCDGSLR